VSNEVDDGIKTDVRRGDLVRPPVQPDIQLLVKIWVIAELHERLAADWLTRRELCDPRHVPARRRYAPAHKVAASGTLDPMNRGATWTASDRTGGPLDELLNQVRLRIPGLIVERSQVTHRGDSDNPWWHPAQDDLDWDEPLPGVIVLCPEYGAELPLWGEGWGNIDWALTKFSPELLDRLAA
jgi:hypothetical protein